MTYDEWFTIYLDLYKRRIAAKTRESYTRLHQLLAPLHRLQLDQLTPDDVQSALIGVELDAGSRQAQLAYTLLHGALRRAVRSKHLTANPVDAVDKPEHQSAEGRAISETEWQQLQPELQADIGLALLAYAGLRRGEALGLGQNRLLDGQPLGAALLNELCVLDGRGHIGGEGDVGDDGITARRINGTVVQQRLKALVHLCPALGQLLVVDVVEGHRQIVHGEADGPAGTDHAAAKAGNAPDVLCGHSGSFLKKHAGEGRPLRRAAVV